jgi:hypothetical protein
MLNIISIVLGYVRTGVEPLDLLQLADDDAPRVRFREDSGMEGSSNAQTDCYDDGIIVSAATDETASLNSDSDSDYEQH